MTSRKHVLIIDDDGTVETLGEMLEDELYKFIILLTE